ncbi:MAG: aldo/keto reductase [Gemmatimonadaceae bacterium]|jgi:aryl-alcohol dehydrogenase-like predicted oxidoreductase|nr:aldo/keto reductase [Gemmatimonadaceae bacterium]
MAAEMEYVQLGRLGVRVSRICLGVAFRGQDDDAVAVRVIDRAIDLGCNFIDCANFYGRGRSEQVLARAMRGKRDDLFITTKVWSRIGPGTNDAGLSRFHIMREVERSLKRLGTDRIDLYLLHNWDPETPLDESLRAMDDLVRQGKVIYTGACNFSATQVVEAMWTADRMGLTPWACLQNQYNLLKRVEIEAELLPLARRHGIGLMTYSPLAIGLLSGRFRRGQTPPADSPWAKGRMNFDSAMSEQNDGVVQCLIDIGKKHNKTPAQVAVAWLLAHPEVTAPMIGPDLPEHVDETFGALGWELTAEDMAALDEASKVVLPGGYA